MRDILVDSGLQEVITYALTEPERDAPYTLWHGLPTVPQGKYVELLNPISSERRVMRHSVLGGVLEVGIANLRHTEDVRLFEIGSVYLATRGTEIARRAATTGPGLDRPASAGVLGRWHWRPRPNRSTSSTSRA